MIQQSTERIGDLDCVVVRDSNCQSPSAAVILCHGFGAPGTDLVGIASEFISQGGPMTDVVYLFPSAPILLDPLFDGRAWWMIDIERIQRLMMEGKAREMKSESPELLPERRKSIIRVVDHCRFEFSIPSAKIIVGGFSQGAMVATDVALHYNETLGGLIVWSGALIDEANWTAQAERQPSLHVVQSHGRIDPILPFAGAEDLRDMLISTGYDVRFFEFNGEHAIPPGAIELAVHLIKDVAFQAVD